MYRIGMIPDGLFRAGLELMTYLDGNLSSYGLDDPALGIQDFILPWWTGSEPPTQRSSYLSSATIKPALDHYRQQIASANIPFSTPHKIRNLADELSKPAYTWHSSVNATVLPNDCNRCRLYRAVAVGVMDQVRDTYNMLDACDVANQAERDIAIRRASGFNELFEAALKKEAEVSVRSGPGPGPETKGKGKQFGPEVKELLKLTKDLVKEASSTAHRKWTWGVDLTSDDLGGMIRGADRDYQVPHSGYDQTLPDGSLQTMSSDLSDSENSVLYDELSGSICSVPDLSPPDYPNFAFVLLDPSGLPVAESDTDPIIEALAKGAKMQATKANKLVMQDEVNQPASFGDDAFEFMPQTAFITRRPWLAPRHPIVLPPSNHPEIITADPDADDEIPDHIDIPDSDEIPNHIVILDSNDIPDDGVIQDSDDIPDHIVIQDSDSPTSDIQFPVSDDELSDRMDVDVGSAEDMYISPVETGPSIRASGAMPRLQRDPTTGLFTPASFAHFPDDLLG